jgi:hypothetical protein
MGQARGCRRPYYSPGMDAPRPRRRGRRQGRGDGDTSTHTRLVRVGLLVTVPAIIALLFAVSVPGALPPAPLEPLFDGEAAAELATTLSTEYPERIPGTLEAEGAARWYRETIGALGLATEDDAWEADIPDLGRVTLRNVVTVVTGRSDETVVVVAHRDNAGTDRPHEDNASATAALIELAKGFAPQETGPDPQPQRTLVFVSTDGGVYGGAGAERFARTSPYAGSAVAAVVLDGLDDEGRPMLSIAGDDPVTSAQPLVGTASARIAERAARTAALPHLLTQLANLAAPFSASEQGRLLANGVAAVTISTQEHHRGTGAAATPRSVSPRRLEALGSASEALVDSLDASVGAPFRTVDSLYFQGRAVSGWAVRLTLVLLVVPFALGLVDLMARVRRRRLPLRPAVRGLRTRLLILLFGGLLVAAGAWTGVFPTGEPLPLPSFSPYVTDPSIAALGVLAILFAVGWLAGRRRLVPVGRVSADERLAGLVAGLALLGLVAIVLAVVQPYALVFVIPSLYAWLWIDPESTAWRRVALFVVGLAGPLLALALLGRELGLGAFETPLYALGLATVGYISISTVLLAIGWLAAASQVGAVAFGRYGPYAGGAEPPPRGPVRSALARTARARATQSSRR